MDKSIHSFEQNVLQTLLRQIREEAGMRQVDLARLLGKPQSFVSKYEAGERRLDLIEVRQICLVAGTSMASFVERLDAMLARECRDKG